MKSFLVITTGVIALLIIYATSAMFMLDSELIYPKKLGVPMATGWKEVAEPC